MGASVCKRTKIHRGVEPTVGEFIGGGKALSRSMSGRVHIDCGFVLIIVRHFGDGSRCDLGSEMKR